MVLLEQVIVLLDCLDMALVVVDKELIYHGFQLDLVPLFNGLLVAAVELVNLVMAVAAAV